MKKPLRNVVMRSPLTGRFYFCAKLVHRVGDIYESVGKKIDVTESLLPYLLQRHVPENLRAARKKVR